MPPKKAKPKKSTVQKGSIKKSMPKKQKGVKKKSIPAPVLNEVLAQIPVRNAPITLVPSNQAINISYLIYVVLQTDRHRIPKILVRKSYASQFEALEAFKREYQMWTSGEDETMLFPAAHKPAQLEGSYLYNLMEVNKQKVASEAPKLEYSIYHRNDLMMDDHNPQKRRCTVVCEQTTFEKAT